MTFFFKHKVIYPHQFGFQSKISTSHAMIELVTAAYNNIDLNLHTGLVLIDFKKAFDTVCHKILCTTTPRGTSTEFLKTGMAL